jgi:mannose-6-phosphate isomerase-like protein (cupin superfamily)
MYSVDITPWGYQQWLDINTYFALKKIVLTPHQEWPITYHRRKYIVIFVLSGEGTIQVERKANLAESGKFFAIEPGMAYKIVSGDVGLVLLETSNFYASDTYTLENYDSSTFKDPLI